MPDDEPSDIITTDGVLCPNCVRSNPAQADFCARCGAPLSQMATLDPLKSTLAEGFACRQAVDGSPRLIVLLGVWLLFLPGVLALPVSLARGALSQPTGEWWPLLLFAPLSAVVLYRATANYLRKRRQPTSAA